MLKKPTRKRQVFSVAMSSLLLTAGIAAGPSDVSAQAINKNTLLSKALPDECFFGAGSGINQFPNPGPCPTGSIPKVNDAYVWGLAKGNTSNLFFGTVANVPCLVAGGLVAGLIQIDNPIQTPSYVCEFGKSTFQVGGKGTDWRPPKLYRYDTITKQQVDLSGAAGAGLNQTLGIRSAGSSPDGSIVILGGPSLKGNSIWLFAFKSNGDFIGSQEIFTYDDIRQWINLNGALYTGVRVTADKSGAVLKWKGTLDNPFAFEEVGKLDAEASYFASLNGQLYVTTWGGGNQSLSGGKLSGLWVSPKTISTATATQWKKLWDVGQYEVDPVTAQTLVGGAVVAWYGQIYWGLMQVPITGLLAHLSYCKDAPTDGLSIAKAIVNTTRPAPLFRINADGTYAKVLYGSTNLAKFDCAAKTWSYLPNKTGAPIMGPAGFGNPFNTYIWAGSLFKNRAYFGTFDWSYLAYDALMALAKADKFQLPAGYDVNKLNADFQASPLYAGQLATYKFGADLWRFDLPRTVAVAESVDGLGNQLNYGIRTFLNDGDASLYVGMANPMNLKTTSGQPKGGWELRELKP